MDLAQVLQRKPGTPVPQTAIPTSSQVPGPATDAAAFCSAASVQSVSPLPASRHGGVTVPAVSPSAGGPTATAMGGLARRYRKAAAR